MIAISNEMFKLDTNREKKYLKSKHWNQIEAYVQA